MIRAGIVTAAVVGSALVDTIAGGKIKKGPGGPPTLALIENPDILAECVSASRHVLAREYYKALMSARKIVEYEERVLNVASGLHSGDSEG